MKPHAKIAMGLVLTAQLAGAQSKKVDFGLLMADAGVRSLDVYSTHRMLENGGHEMVLPDAISHHTGAMAAFSAGMVGFDWLVSGRLEKHHPRLAHIEIGIDMGQDSIGAIHNFFVSGSKPSIKTLPRKPRF